MTQRITGELFKKMIVNAAAAIDNHKNEVNELNVFPVPDGDTGTNMSLTMSAADKALATMSPGTLGHTADVVANALLRGARGNSGVIISLLFRGFSRRLKDADSADAAQFASALSAGVDSAYKAIMKPTEGTILTVSRLLSGAAVAAAESESDIEKILELALEAGYDALADTINQNPVLMKAGVIDAGGKGYLYIIDAMLKAMHGELIEKSAVGATEDKADFTQFDSADIKYAYCTELMVERKSKKDVNRFRDFLDKRGDSVVVVDDDEIIKVHVHTNEPGTVLTEALTFGPVQAVKIENMRLQHSQVAAAGSSEAPPAEPADLKDYATVVVCAGVGLEEVFRDLGADRLVTGGQTMNPSTEDILIEVNSAPSDVVFILPNNKNIILAAQQCVPLTDKRIVVIPTKSIPQGISAMLAIDAADGIEDMPELMEKAAKRVRTALITRAVRDSNFDEMDIKEGEYIALLDSSLAASGSDFKTIVDAITSDFRKLSPEFITVFTGEDAVKKEIATVSKRLASASPGAEISIINGAQPVYHYIISAE